MYEMYLDGVRIPVTPSKITLKIKNKNNTINLVNGLEINILKSANLSDYEFDLLIPAVKYPFAIYPDGFKNINFYLDKFEKWKTKKKPIRLIVLREMPNGKPMHQTNTLVSLEEYSVKEDSNNGIDTVISVKLKQFIEHRTNIKIYEKVKNSQGKIKQVSSPTKTNNSNMDDTKSKTYKVTQGDTLWEIAKRTYGDGNMYKKIHELNKDIISNPNIIRVGQTLKMP